MQTLKLSRQEAAAELLRRRRARRSLVDYANAIEVPGKPVSEDADEWLFQPIETSVTAHHRLLLEAIERTAARRHGRLMVFMPPGSAKSTYTSVVAPTWLMGKNPGYRIILASYGSDLARRHGRRARQICRQSGFESIFGAGIASDTSAADEWALSNGSEYLAGGILSGITGNRANGLLIDDPVKGREDADSPVIRKKTREAFDDDLMTRLIPGGWIVLVQTRWHEADLAGGILPEKYDGRSGMIECRDGQTWEVLSLPAEAERADDPLGRAQGEMLWPEWFDERHWANFRANPRTWASLYQQRPAPDSGGYFDTTKIARYGIAPKGVVIIGASDYAVTEDGGDYTEHGIIGIDHASRWHLLDWWRSRTSSDAWIESQLDLVEKWRPAIWFGEAGPIRRAVEPFLAKRMQQRGLACWLEWLASIHDKPTRARSLQALIAMGWLSVPEGRPWVPALMDQLQAFPAGAFDDGVDVLSLAARGMQKFGKGLLPEPEKAAPPPPTLGRVPARILDAPEEKPVSRYKA